MTELEQLRAQNLELQMQVERLKGVMEAVKQTQGIENTDIDFDMLNSALSQPIPTRLGADVLALARAGFKFSLAITEYLNNKPVSSTSGYVAGEMGLRDAAQPFIENADKRKWLGVE